MADEILTGVSRETIHRLQTLAGELEKWSKRINLIGPGTGGDIWHRHILDSMQILHHGCGAKIWIDIGSGAGLPGMVIATALADQSDSECHLVESNRKKTAFLRSVRPLVAPRASIYDMRIEDAVSQLPVPDVVTARAVASLDQLFEWTACWHPAQPRYLLPKGRGYQKEIEDSQKRWSYCCSVHPSRIDPESVILDLTRVTRL